MSDMIKCKFCGEEIQAGAVKCKHCGEWLSSEVSRGNKFEMPFEDKISTFLMLVFTVLTLGIYPIVWIGKRYKIFNALNPNKKPQLTISWVIALSILLLAEFSFPPICYISTILYTILSFKMLKKIEIYAKEKYGKTIKYNGFAWFFFTLFYVNYAINSFSDRLSEN